MATFNSLTVDEKATLLAYAVVHRGNVVSLCKALNNLALADSVWNTTVKVINAKLDVGEVIPDVNGLAGAQAFTMTDLLNAMNALETMLATNNSPIWRAAYVKFAGVNNTMLTG